MSNNSSTSLMAKNISSYATIGSAFLGGLVGFFIGKSMGPSEPEVEEVEVEESVSSMPLSNEVEESISSSPLNVSSSSSLPLVENEVKIESEEEQVFPKLSQVEEPLVLPTSQQVVPVSETTKEVQQAVLNPLSPEPMALEEPKPLTPTPAPSGIQGGKTKTRRSRKHHKRSSRKYIGGQAAAVIVPPS
jgi:hypothetical protein